MSGVLLIYPYHQGRGNRSSFRLPPLGVGYVAASLRAAGHETHVLDGTFMDNQSLVDQAIRLAPDVIGIYSMVTMRDEAMRLAVALRGHCRLLVVGGPMPSADAPPFLEAFDVAVLGEAEETVPELVGAYAKGLALDSIPGLALGGNGGCHLTAKRALLRGLDAIAFPARDLLPNQQYCEHGRRRYGYSITSVMSSRGCPFRCEFCSNPVFGVSYRERSAANVVDEVEDALAYGYDRIHFGDDVFTLNGTRLMAICAEIERRGLRFGWECLARVDSMDREKAAAMRQAGCTRVFFGIESANPSVLALMNKKINPEMARAAVVCAHEAGLQVGAFFIVCYPGDTDATVLETLAFATRLPLDYLSFSMPYPLPGTLLYERVKDRAFREWKQPEGPFFDHTCIFDADFSARKMKFAVLKGRAEFHARRRLGRVAPLVCAPFERGTDAWFRLMH